MITKTELRQKEASFFHNYRLLARLLVASSSRGGHRLENLRR